MTREKPTAAVDACDGLYMSILGWAVMMIIMRNVPPTAFIILRKALKNKAFLHIP